MYKDYNINIDTANISEIMRILGAFFIAFIFIIMVFSTFMILVKWKTYKKAGKEGWETLIPFYNNWVLFEISSMEGWYSLLVFIPIFGPIVYTIFLTMAYVKLSKSFGKSSMFAVGLLFFPIVFFAILAFDKSEYSQIKEVSIKI